MDEIVYNSFDQAWHTNVVVHDRLDCFQNNSDPNMSSNMNGYNNMKNESDCSSKVLIDSDISK